jgi:hypothetical protein
MDTTRERLKRILDEFELLTLPKLGNAHDLVDGADIDLYLEEADVHIAARYFLERGALGAQTEVVFDPTIDQRLERAEATDNESRVKIDAMKQYRRKLLELIEALSVASGLRVITKEQQMSERSAGAPPAWPPS